MYQLIGAFISATLAIAVVSAVAVISINLAGTPPAPYRAAPGNVFVTSGGI